MRKWKNVIDGTIQETDEDLWLSPNWFPVDENKEYSCEHGHVGCLIPGDHMPEECHDASMVKQQEAEILQFTGTTTKDIDPQSVVDALQDVKFKRLLVIGFDENEELYCASHTSDIGALLLLMERAKHHLLFEIEAE